MYLVSNQIQIDFIDYLSSVVYSPENLERAYGYLKKRSVDMSKFRYPWTVTGQSVVPFKIFDTDTFEKKYPPYIFTESLYIPITDITNPTRLVGFDVRYVGVDDRRLRFHKFKRSESDVMFYYTKPIYEIGSSESLIITEGAIDAESIAQFGWNVLSPLTANHNLRFLLFLYTITDHIYFMYDNDSTGKRALEQIMGAVDISDQIRNSFHTIPYTGKDPNQTLCSLGRDYLGYMIQNQINIGQHYDNNG